jgi:hypothetical protein
MVVYTIMALILQVKESKAGLSHSQIGNPCRSDSDCLSDGWETCDI